jgi:hypothetical protein
MVEWINVNHCLPCEDGFYEVMGYLNIKIELSYYNGLGFLVHGGEYYPATVWRRHLTENNKKYGKVK